MVKTNPSLDGYWKDNKNPPFMSEILVDGLCLRARAYSSKLKSGSFVSARMVSSVFSFSGRFEPIRETPAEFFQKVGHDFTWLFMFTRQSVANFPLKWN